MVILRGDLWWVELSAPTASGPGHRRPVVVVQADAFNRSRIGTVVVAVVTSNQALAAAPGNTAVASADSGLPRDSVVDASQLLTLDRRDLVARAGRLPGHVLEQVDAGLRLVLGLERGAAW